jgi:actin-like ATPase involved in cell morphogenesis
VRLAPVSLAALVAAVALAGCSSQSNSKAADDYSGAQKDVVTVVDDLVNNATKKDGKEICTTVFAKDLAAELQQGAKDCADAVNDQLDDASNWDLDVVKNGVTVSGDTATVKTTSDFDGKTTNRTLTLAKQDNDWRITGIEGGS